MPWWMTPAPAAADRPAEAPAPATAFAPLDASVAIQAPATLIATASSRPLHVRLRGRSGDRIELLVESAAYDRDTFGPLASVILLVMRAGRAQVLTGRVDGPARREGRSTVIGIAVRNGIVHTEARETHRVPVPAGLGLRAHVVDGRGRRFSLQPEDISLRGLGGLLPDAPERALAPGTEVWVELELPEMTEVLQIRAEVRMRRLGADDRPARCGLRFVPSESSRQDGTDARLQELVDRCEQAHLESAA
jgi:hypothetical protein